MLDCYVCCSLALLQALQSVPFRRIEYDLIIEIFIFTTTLLKQGIEIVFLWTTGYEDILANGKEDRLARQAHTNQCTTSCIKLSSTESKKLVNRIFGAKFQ